jgi:hypothetical protein
MDKESKASTREGEFIMTDEEKKEFQLQDTGDDPEDVAKPEEVSE